MTRKNDDPLNGGISTATLAKRLDCKPRSILVRLCRTGSFHGIRPKKLPSGRLLWPTDAVERLLQGSGKAA